MPGKISALRSPFYSNHIGNTTFVISAEGVPGANQITVNVQLKNTSGGDLTTHGHIHWFFSDDTLGNSLVATAIDTVAAGTDGWISADVAGKRGIAMSEADGDLDFVLTMAGAKTAYLGMLLPDGSRVMSTALVWV